MATSLPYLSSYKNLETLFEKIQSAKIPEKFNHSFLQTTIGLKGSNDRPLIPLLRTMGFIDQSGTPTADYRLLKSKISAKRAIADAVRRSYSPLFEADEHANALNAERLKGLIAQVAGTDDDMTKRIYATFNALSKLADFSGGGATETPKEEDQEVAAEGEPAEAAESSQSRGRPLRPEFHYNIQIHLPANATEEVYLSIFNALRKTFQ